MLRPSGLGLEGDSIACRSGFDGRETAELHRMWRSQWSKWGQRLSIAINTHYPTIEGGYYLNRAIFVLISECLQEVDLRHVILDIWRDDGLVPTEGFGQFETDEDYVLA